MFELATSEGIIDIPAGTNYETTVSTYDNNVVMGSIGYENEYGNYNHVISKGSGAGEWKFVKMTACE